MVDVIVSITLNKCYSVASVVRVVQCLMSLEAISGHVWFWWGITMEILPAGNGSDPQIPTSEDFYITRSPGI